MRVVLVCPYDLQRPGGGQHHVLELADRLLQRGVDARLIGPGLPPTVAGTNLGPAVAIPANRSTVPISLDPRAWRKARQAMAGADVVHVHEPFMPLVSWAALKTGRPTVVTFHADPGRWITALYRWGGNPGRRLLAGALLTAVSPIAARPIPASWGEVKLIPIAIDLASYGSNGDRQEQRVAFLGRDDPRKGLDVLLTAWPAIRATCPQAELLVMGAVRSDPLPGVRYLGRVSEKKKREWLGSSAVFVAPNTGGESFGTVLAEAMASRCAVVASDLPAFRWVGGQGALFVPPKDEEALTSALLALLNDPQRAAELGRAAASEAARFDWKVVVDAYLDCYRQAASMPSRAAK